MKLDDSCLQQKPNQDVIAFLENASVRKIAISQQTKGCEIFLACRQLPTPELYLQSLRFFTDNMTQASGLRLVVQPLQHLQAAAFLEQHFQLFITMLQQQHPTVAGWLYNSYWQIDGETLTIFIGQEIGIRFLHNMRFTLQASILLDEILQEKLTVQLQCDQAIKPPELQKREEPVVFVAAEAKAAVKPAEKPGEEIVLLGKLIKDTPRPIESFEEEEKFVTVEGRIFGLDVRELKNGKQLLTFKITDDRDSITCKVIKEADEIKELKGKLKKVKALKVKGSVREDTFARELTLMAYDLNLTKLKKRSDLAADKRIELHLHTNMSANDALCDVADLIQLAADMGHEAIAITDHGVVQSFPEAYHAGQAAGVKIIYGVEGYIFDDDLPKEEQRTYHCIILAKNKAGLKALYQLVTESNLNFFYRRPRIPKRLLAAVRENLVLGSACEAGELIQTYIKTNKDHDALVRIAEFYDFLEVQPHGNNEFMLRKGIFSTEAELKQINLDIYALGQELGKPVVATGDVHFANKGDSIYRAILMAGKKFEDADQQAPLYYRNTEEMLAEFDYFPPEVAREIVITNPKKIVADFEELKPVPDGPPFFSLFSRSSKPAIRPSLFSISTIFTRCSSSAAMSKSARYSTSVQHLAGFHKPVILVLTSYIYPSLPPCSESSLIPLLVLSPTESALLGSVGGPGFIRVGWGVLHLPAFQKMQIIAQHPQTAHFLLPVCFQQRTLRFGQGSRRRGLVRVNPEILCQLLRCLVTAQAKQPCHKVNHIAGGSAAETVKIPFVQLHAGVPVLMERTTAHPISVDLQPIVFRRIRHTNILFYQFKECHENPSVSGHKKSGLPGLLGQAAVFMQFVMFPFLWLSASPAGRTSPGRRVCRI